MPVKRPHNIYMYDCEWSKLLVKLRGMGFSGRAMVSQFLEKVITTHFIFLEGKGKVAIEYIYSKK